MDINFNEDQRMLMDTARRFFEKEAPKSLVRELVKDENGYSPEVWKKMSELGWLGLPFDEEYGGYGGSFLDLAVLLEEMGRAVVPTPFFSTVILSGLLIQDYGTTELKKEYIPRIVEGECISTLAFVGKTGSYSKREIGLEAEPVGASYSLNGSAFFVPYAHVADMIICAARMPSTNGADVTLFVVNGKTEGLEAIPLRTISGYGSEGVVNLKDVDVSPDHIIGEVGKGWEYIKKLWPRVAAALSCECVGG